LHSILIIKPAFAEFKNFLKHYGACAWDNSTCILMSLDFYLKGIAPNRMSGKSDFFLPVCEHQKKARIYKPVKQQ